MKGFGGRLVAWKDEGEETVNGVTCDLLSFRETKSRVTELWVARGKSPYAVKYVDRFPNPLATNQMMYHSETISGWKENDRIPAEHFAFEPLAGAIERESDTDQAEMSETVTNGERKEVVRFASHSDLVQEAGKLNAFLKKNQAHFQAVAQKSILEEYKDLTASDLTFVNIQPDSTDSSERNFVVTFVLRKTVKTTETNHSIQTTEQTCIVTLSAEGRVERVSRRSSFSFSSK